jgi:hypothetical protein
MQENNSKRGSTLLHPPIAKRNHNKSAEREREREREREISQRGQKFKLGVFSQWEVYDPKMK